MKFLDILLSILQSLDPTKPVYFSKDKVYCQTGKSLNTKLQWKIKDGFLKPADIQRNIQTLDLIRKYWDSGFLVSITPYSKGFKVVVYSEYKIVFNDTINIINSGLITTYVLKKVYKDLVPKKTGG